MLGIYSLMPTFTWLQSVSLFFKLKCIPIFLSHQTQETFSSFSTLLNLNAPNCLRNRFQFLSDLHGLLGRYARASLYDLKVPYPHGNSGKRTLAYSATKILNELRSDLREFSTSSSPPTFKFLPPLFNLNYKISFSHPYPLASTWRICCAWFAAILLIVIFYIFKFLAN